MIDTFNLRLNATELQDYMDSQPLAGTRMVFNENTPGVHVRYTPRNDTDMLYFKMKWADDILKPGVTPQHPRQRHHRSKYQDDRRAKVSARR